MRPFVLLLRADQDDCPEGFQMRMDYRLLPQLLRIAGRVQPILIDWPDEYRSKKGAKEDFEWLLSSKLGCDPPGLKGELKNRPVTLIRTIVNGALWRNRGAEMLDAFLEFSQGLRVPGSGVVIAEVLFLVPRGAPAEAVRRSGLTSLFGFFRPRGEPKNQDRVLAESIGTELARLEAGIAEENGTLADYSGLRAAVCEFIPITASHAQTWVGDVDVRAWCGAQTEADMWKELRHCVSAYGTRMSRLVDPMYGLFMKYRKAGG